VAWVLLLSSTNKKVFLLTSSKQINDEEKFASSVFESLESIIVRHLDKNTYLSYAIFKLQKLQQIKTKNDENDSYSYLKTQIKSELWAYSFRSAD